MAAPAAPTTMTGRPCGIGLGLRWAFFDEALTRLDAGDRALDTIDFFEISPENYARRGDFVAAALERFRAHRPFTTHGLTMNVGGLDPLRDDYFRDVGAVLARVDPPFHSDHLCFTGGGGRVLHDLLPIPQTRASARNAAARAREAADRLERPFVLENVTHYLVPGAAVVPEADFLADVLEASGAGLLLDVNNVYVNALNYGFDAADFLARIPLERVVEIHVAGHERDDEIGLLIDTHGAPVVDPVLALLEDVVARTGPVPVLLERDNDVPSLDELLEELGRVRRAVDRGLARRAAGEERAHAP
jgi:hypothetical protein